MSLVKNLHKRLFSSVLYENRDFRVVEYEESVKVELTDAWDREITVYVEFEGDNEMSESTVNLSSESTSSCRFKRDRISVLEVKHHSLEYRLGEPNTSSQYIVVSGEQFDGSTLHDTKFGHGMSNHLSVTTHRQTVPEVVDVKTDNDIKSSDVVIEIFGFSDDDENLYFRPEDSEPLTKININELSKAGVFDLRDSDLTERKLYIHLPSNFEGRVSAGEETLESPFDRDTAVFSSRSFFDGNYETLCFNGETPYPIKFPIEVEMDGFVPESKVMTVSEGSEELNLSFTEDEFTELGTVYLAITDVLPDVSARGGDGIGKYYNVERIEDMPPIFEDDKLFTNPNHSIYKIEDVRPNEQVTIHYGFDGLPSDPILSKTTIEEGETKYLFEDISYSRPLIKFKNTCETTLRVTTDVENINLSPYESNTLSLDSEELAYSVVDVESDGSSILYEGVVTPSQDYRTLIEIGKNGSQQVLPKSE